MAVKDRGSALDGFYALYDGTGNRDRVIAQPISCHVTLEYELVRKWQMAQRASQRSPTLRGQPLGLMPELYPFDMLKRPLLEEARLFVRAMALQHYEPLTDISAFEVWGPYTEKVGAVRDWTPEADNQLIPDHAKKTAWSAWLHSEGESNIRLGCAFFIRAQFTRQGKYGHVDEERGVIVV